METKGEKFARLAEARTNKALKTLELLTNLGGSQYNDGSQEQREYKRKICGRLLAAVQEIEDSWSQKTKADRKKFSLNDDGEGE